MSWDPEIDNAATVRRRLAESTDPNLRLDTLPASAAGGTVPPLEPRAPLDPRAPIDPNAPVSGHLPAPEPRVPVAAAPEQDWEAARALLFPLLRPSGTLGVALDEFNSIVAPERATRSHTQPLVDAGPLDLVVVFAMHSGGFDVIVNGDHLLAWGVTPTELRETATGNLAAWSAGAGWTDETSGARRLISSDTGAGWDASRILLPAVRRHLVAELGPLGRVLVGLPDRHLLVAATLQPGDEEFGALFGEFVREQSGEADEPIDRRVFELAGEELVRFRG